MVKKVKKICIFILFLICGLCAFGQEKKAAIGLGAEWNMDAHRNFAGGAALDFNYRFRDDYALGFTFTGSNNFRGFVSIEPTISFRWYYLVKNYPGFFGQMDAGFFIYFEDDEVTTLPELGVRGGYRLPLGSSFFVEPYARMGYPFAFSIGVMGGLLF